MDIYLSVHYCTASITYTVRFTWERLTHEQFLGRFLSIADQPVRWGLTGVSAERKLETLFPEIDSPALRSELWSLTFTASIAFISSPAPAPAHAHSLIESLIRFPSEINYSSESSGWWWQTASLSTSHYSLHVTAFPFLRFELTSSSTKVLY